MIRSNTESFDEFKTRIINNVSVLYKPFPDIYNNYINKFFPTIYESLKYNKNYDLLVIVVEFKDYSGDIMPTTTKCFFQLTEGEMGEERVQIYDIEDENNPLKLSHIDYLKTPFIQGLGRFKLVHSEVGEEIHLHDKTPMLSKLKKELKDRFKAYLGV